MVIDFHTHIFPDKIAKRTIEILEENIIKVGNSQKAYTSGSLDELKQSMRENGVDYSVVLPIATNVRQHVSINKFAESINGHDGIFSFGSLHPMQENWEETLYDIKEKGLRGIKLHPEYQDFFIDSPESVKILKKCEELGLMTVLHAGRDVGAPPPVHCTPERLRRVIGCEVSGKNIIAAHMGGWKMWEDVEKYLVGTELLLDTAYTFPFIEKDRFLRILNDHGSEKILFATDSPWEIPGQTVDYIRSLELTEEQEDNIFYKNALKILKISPKDACRA